MEGKHKELKVKIKNRLILGTAVFFLVVALGAITVFMMESQQSEPKVVTPLPSMAPSQAVVTGEAGAPSGGEVVKLQSTVLVEVYRPVGDAMVQVYRHESSNVITNVGLAALARHLGGQTAAFQWTSAMGGNDKWYRSTAPIYIALSTDATGVDAAHSSWQAVDGSYPSDIEITTGGLARSTGTLTIGVAYTAGSGGTKGSHTYTLSKTFTVTPGNSFTGVQKAGLFNNVYNTNDGSTSALQISALIAENTFTPVDLNAGDQIAITWRITL